MIGQEHQNFKNLAMWAIIVFLTIGLYNMFKNPQANNSGSNKIIFSDFDALIFWIIKQNFRLFLKD